MHVLWLGHGTGTALTSSVDQKVAAQKEKSEGKDHRGRVRRSQRPPPTSTPIALLTRRVAQRADGSCKSPITPNLSDLSIHTRSVTPVYQRRRRRCSARTAACSSRCAQDGSERTAICSSTATRSALSKAAGTARSADCRVEAAV